MEPLGFPTLISAMSNLSNLQVKYLNFPRLNCKCLSSGISVSIAPSRYSLGAFHVNSMKSVPNKFFFSLTAWCPQDISFPPRLGGEGGNPNQISVAALFAAQIAMVFLKEYLSQGSWSGICETGLETIPLENDAWLGLVSWSSSATLERADGHKFGPQSHPS